MTDQAKPASRPWLRFLRFSVRGMIVLVLVIGGWLGWLVRSARIQREAVAAIERAGGSVEYDWRWKKSRTSWDGEPLEPIWLVKTMGVDYFAHASRAILEANGTDQDLAQVGRLPSLAAVALVESKVTDAGLRHMRGLTNLSDLQLFFTNQITDAGLEHLKGLKSLSQLELMGTQVTDAGLLHIKGFTRLTVLDLEQTRVTDAGLAQLREFTNLSRLNVSLTKVTDAGLVHLRGLTKLASLDLGGTEVTDSGLVHLDELTNLTYLGLMGTQVTDAGLLHLKVLTNLSILEINGAQVTSAGVQGLERELPKLTIYP